MGFIPPLWQPDEVDAIEQVTTEEAMAMTRRLATEEAIFAGTSTGANVVAALHEAERLGSKATVLTIVVDSGLRYLSTDLYGCGAHKGRRWGIESGFGDWRGAGR